MGRCHSSNDTRNLKPVLIIVGIFVLIFFFGYIVGFKQGADYERCQHAQRVRNWEKYDAKQWKKLERSGEIYNPPNEGEEK
jgi:hypothetical protein